MREVPSHFGHGSNATHADEDLPGREPPIDRSSGSQSAHLERSAGAVTSTSCCCCTAQRARLPPPISSARFGVDLFAERMVLRDGGFDLREPPSIAGDARRDLAHGDRNGLEAREQIVVRAQRIRRADDARDSAPL